MFVRLTCVAKQIEFLVLKSGLLLLSLNIEYFSDLTVHVLDKIPDLCFLSSKLLSELLRGSIFVSFTLCEHSLNVLLLDGQSCLDLIFVLLAEDFIISLVDLGASSSMNRLSVVNSLENLLLDAGKLLLFSLNLVDFSTDLSLLDLERPVYVARLASLLLL